MAPPTPSRGTSPAPPAPRNAASASRRGPRPTVLLPRAPVATPPGCPPARKRARSPPARARAKGAGRRPRSPPRSARVAEGEHHPSGDRPSPGFLPQLLGRHQTDVHGVERRLSAAAHVQLREDAVHVGLDGRLTDEELARDLVVGLAAGD